MSRSAEETYREAALEYLGASVWRTPSFGLALPPLRLMHLAKRGFEALYLHRSR